MDNELKIFWEKCGFETELYIFPDGSTDCDSVMWKAPDSSGWDIAPPELTLNNLFDYAVPLVDGLRIDGGVKNGYYVIVGINGTVKTAKDKDLAIALYKALKEVL